MYTIRVISEISSRTEDEWYSKVLLLF